MHAELPSRITELRERSLGILVREIRRRLARLRERRLGRLDELPRVCQPLENPRACSTAHRVAR